ncbi:gas vesicle protein GvpJ [Halalkalicoccus sp. NIPERK01]|uniref:gas vesicle protein GvpJ n=1 Tax=Halalkalicoccus sp. NIPERK01 TaxID=3053469 RepID=UPI00256F4EFB|nr:gas vesicle protein [Halalkalicoccus sp. NIPERK01]MDL5363088.1 gas vesicle protein [Halalkalicoccus sp. NIPERK01]
MSSAKPTRQQSDLADVLELVLDKGIVINADIAVTIGDTELLGIEIRAAIASFETAAQYGLAFPSGTDMRRVEQASGREPLEIENEQGERETIDLGISASEGGSNAEDDETAGQRSPSKRPDPEVPTITSRSGRSDESRDGGDDDEDNGDENGS